MLEKQDFVHLKRGLMSTKHFLICIILVLLQGCGSSKSSSSNTSSSFASASFSSEATSSTASISASSNNSSSTRSRLMGGFIQSNGSPLDLTGELNVLIGRLGIDGSALKARFKDLGLIENDGANLYLMDNKSGVISRLNIERDEVLTLVGSNNLPKGLETNIGFKDGEGSSALFNAPKDMVVLGEYLYIADSGNHCIRKVNLATGYVSTFAGLPEIAGSDDGIIATFNNPSGITTDGFDLYVADTGNNAIRKISLNNGEVTTIAGAVDAAGYKDGVGAATRFKKPNAIAYDANYLFVYDSGNNAIRQIDISSTQVTTIVESLSLTDPKITTDGIYLYVLDQLHVRKINIASKEVTLEENTEKIRDLTVLGGAFYSINKLSVVELNPKDDSVKLVAGSPLDYVETYFTGFNPFQGIYYVWFPYYSDGDNSKATFVAPDLITTDGINFYIADFWSESTRKYDPITGFTSSMGFSGGYRLTGLTTDGIYLYASNDRAIYRMNLATGYMSLFAGYDDSYSIGNTDGYRLDARFYDSRAIVTDSENLYIIDYMNNTVRKLSLSTELVTTLAGQVQTNGHSDGDIATFLNMRDITTDGTSLFVTEDGQVDGVDISDIRKIDVSSGFTTTLNITHQGEPFIHEKFSAITSDGFNLYVAETGETKNRILKISIETGEATELVQTKNYEIKDLIADKNGLYIVNYRGTIVHVQ